MIKFKIIEIIYLVHDYWYYLLSYQDSNLGLHKNTNTHFFLIIIYLLHIMPYILNQLRSVFFSSKLKFVNHLAYF